MQDLSSFLDSGILERYVMGQTTVAEDREVAHMAALFPEVQDQLESWTTALEQYASAHATAAPETIRPFLMATINYISRIESGEIPAAPPLLHAASSPEDYAAWLNRPDLQLEDPEEDVKALIIGHTPEALTAIVWLKRGALPEEHSTEYEKFLVIEGTCMITIGEEVHYLKPGDRLDIPLYTTHSVHVTSDTHCKVILQRVAVAA